MSNNIRTRFAPSPTGHLHIGGARTALFSYLYARHTGGDFILRIEDTDLERSTPESVQAILDGMKWLNLEFDEGPFFQTHRFERYQTVIQDLLSQGLAYRCTCSKERLEQLRETQFAQKQKPRYDGCCREKNIQTDSSYVVRFKNPLTGTVSFQDKIRGQLQFENSELDDLIIARSDGSPTYNFTVVVDDWDMKITDVIRGDDHINNTPRQINILAALGANIPNYAHVPMILGTDGKRLSKRHGATSVMDYREQGFLPHALLNYLVRLGWSHKDQEIFSRDELIQFFDMTCINHAPAAMNLEKLLWLNQHYLKTIDATELVSEFIFHCQLQNIQLSGHLNEHLIQIIQTQKERCKTLKEMAERSRFFFEEFEIQAELCAPFAEMKHHLLLFLNALSDVTEWKKEPLHELLKQFCETQQIKLGDLAKPLRLALAGSAVSPPMDITLTLLGKEKSLMRIQKWIDLF